MTLAALTIAANFFISYVKKLFVKVSRPGLTTQLLRVPISLVLPGRGVASGAPNKQSYGVREAKHSYRSFVSAMM